MTKLLLRKSRTRSDFDLFRRSTPLIQETLRKSAQSVFTGFKALREGKDQLSSALKLSRKRDGDGGLHFEE